MSWDWCKPLSDSIVGPKELRRSASHSLLESKYLPFLVVRTRLNFIKVIREGPSLVLKSTAKDGERGESRGSLEDTARPRDGTNQGQARGTRNITKSTNPRRLYARG